MAIIKIFVPWTEFTFFTIVHYWHFILYRCLNIYIHTRRQKWSNNNVLPPPSTKVSHMCLRPKMRFMSIMVTTQVFGVFDYCFKTFTRKGQNGHLFGHLFGHLYNQRQVLTPTPVQPNQPYVAYFEPPKGACNITVLIFFIFGHAFWTEYF